MLFEAGIRGSKSIARERGSYTGVVCQLASDLLSITKRYFTSPFTMRS